MTDTADLTTTANDRGCARCGCPLAEHHKLHCEGRNGDCICAGGWLEPGSTLTEVDKVVQDQLAEHDAAQTATAREPSGETRVVLVKPGEVLVFGRVGEVDPQELNDAADRLRELLGLKVLFFAGDIDLAVIPDDAGGQ